ncbi:MAG: hypothetical protein COW01_07370 [Bdellovibrionales bacterium CG12_big_fil_rev_8_21_14_0_65_38_15]|nr:MAG: hypothetical protein COW79_06535 [Bdellovibrionales bacterium CG22_combo_CG10-13_8_21_14_all_38_13]PIQ55450.1 MAG: hypothetical protein COW01_07370 [Bdellovibrionales bacterium CG12_big_fil_rev_8_21_14_0_65_38_15]PIR29191.1 MAG: hypothetical protein COV38_12105 [Bdellovibrionales bacterium CG11_big_fil_rev_8_21_14_0_20_38_13]
MKKQTLPFGIKFFIFTVIIVATVSYGLYEKGKYDVLKRVSSEPILKSMPDFQVSLLDQDAMLEGKQWLAESPRGGFIHFWGTWCAPCEAEFPAFLKFAKKFEQQNVRFLLIAVNDQRKDVLKFLKRFPDISSNVTIVIDENNSAMPNFGTVKVPETYLFAPNGKNLNKFVGPQEWQLDSYVTRSQALLSNAPVNTIDVETH